MRYKKAQLLFLIFLLMFTAHAPSVHAFGEGAQGPDVYAVQGMLKSLGSFAGEIDGVYGASTAAGVRYFQQQHGLPVTGQVDDATLQSILWAYGELRISKQPPNQPNPAPEPDPVPEPSPNEKAPALSAVERKMVDLINLERTREGLAALTPDLELSQVARIKSAEMIEKDYFSHTSPSYGSPFDMMKKFGITYRTAGENIACNQNVENAHEALMNSPGHRKNILSSDFTRVGIGIVDGGMCGQMYTQMFIGK